MVDVCEGIDAAQGVVVHLSDDTVDHPRRSRGGGNLAGVKDVEAQCIVRLVAGAVGDGYALAESKFACCGFRGLALEPECRNPVGQHALWNAEMLEQRLADVVLPKIPEDAFRKSAQGGPCFSRKPHGDVVARKHHLVYAVEDLRFVFPYPCQFGGSKVSGTVEQVPQAVVFAQAVKSPFAETDGAGVAPYDGGTQHLLVFVHAHQSVHLV